MVKNTASQFLAGMQRFGSKCFSVNGSVGVQNKDQIVLFPSLCVKFAQIGSLSDADIRYKRHSDGNQTFYFSSKGYREAAVICLHMVVILH